MFDLWPEVVPVEGGTEFALVAFEAVSTGEGPEVEGYIASGRALGNVEAAGAVAAFAADLSELGGTELAAVAGGHFKANGVATNARGVRLGMGADQGIKGNGMQAIAPNLCCGRVAAQTRFASHKLG